MPYKDKDKRKEYNKIYQKGYRVKNGDKTRESVRKYRRLHKEEAKEQNKKYRKNNPERVKMWKRTINERFVGYKFNAKKRGLVFNLSLAEFKNMVGDNCYYCGDPGYGIDRPDNSQGYIEGNMVSCCTMCNRMKTNYLENEFIEQCQKIANHLLKKLAKI